MDKKRFVKYYAPSAHFKLTNPNPRWANMKGMVWHTGDCCIRALALSTDSEWIKAYDYLSNKARRDYSVPNDGPDFRKWLIEGGATWIACKAEKGKKRMTALQFAESHPQGRYVLTLANHECACVDGIIQDAWNCGEKCVVGYFNMTDFKYE